MTYYEFENETELGRHLKYWSNACGDLHHNGEYDLATYPNSQKNYKGHTSTFGKKETDALNTSLNTTTGTTLHL